MTNDIDLKPTHVIEGWQHIFADGTQGYLRLYVAKDADGWQLIAARKEGNRLTTRAELADVIESFDQHVASGYSFDDEVEPMTEDHRREL